MPARNRWSVSQEIWKVLKVLTMKIYLRNLFVCIMCFVGATQAHAALVLDANDVRAQLGNGGSHPFDRFPCNYSSGVHIVVKNVGVVYVRGFLVCYDDVKANAELARINAIIMTARSKNMNVQIGSTLRDFAITNLLIADNVDTPITAVNKK